MSIHDMYVTIILQCDQCGMRFTGVDDDLNKPLWRVTQRAIVAGWEASPFQTVHVCATCKGKNESSGD